MLAQVAGSAVGLIVIFSDAVWAVWVGTFIFGLGMAASYGNFHIHFDCSACISQRCMYHPAHVVMCSIC